MRIGTFKIPGRLVLEYSSATKCICVRTKITAAKFLDAATGETTVTLGKLSSKYIYIYLQPLQMGANETPKLSLYVIVFDEVMNIRHLPVALQNIDFEGSSCCCFGSQKFASKVYTRV